MPSNILSFPARIPITADGKLASREFMHFLIAAISRMGGISSNDLASVIQLLAELTARIDGDEIELAFTDSISSIAELRKEVDDLKLQIALMAIPPALAKEVVYDSIFG